MTYLTVRFYLQARCSRPHLRPDAVHRPRSHLPGRPRVDRIPDEGHLGGDAEGQQSRAFVPSSRRRYPFQPGSNTLSFLQMSWILRLKIPFFPFFFWNGLGCVRRFLCVSKANFYNVFFLVVPTS